MLSSTIVLSGKVVVENVMFSWWVTDGLRPKLTVSHAVHGTETHPRHGSDPKAQARAIARAMLAGKPSPSQARGGATAPASDADDRSGDAKT